MNRKSLFLNLLFYSCLVIGAAAAVVYVVLPELNNVKALRSRQEENKEAIASYEAEIQELRHKQALFESNPEFVEKIAHEQGYVTPGEKVILFEGNQ